MKKKRKLKKKVVYFIILLIVTGFSMFYCSLSEEDKERILQKPIIISYLLKERKHKEQINNCLESPEIPNQVKDSLADLEKELDDYLLEYNIGFKYKEKTYNYELSYNSDKVFYGASLIKLVDADYLLDKDVDLNTTKKYEDKHRMAYSKGVSQHKIGDEIKLGDLLSYAISVSDNSAHLMLIDYIGFNTLKEYGKSLGGKVILEGGDLFGNQTADDMILYLDKAYELINTKENGNILKEALLNTEVNYLNFDDIIFGHKYGSHNYFFHDVGIYFSDKPYLIAVLTTSDSNKKIVTEISRKVYKIHQSLVEAKIDYCNNIET